MEKICDRCGFVIKKFFDVHVSKCDGRGPSRSRRHQGLGKGYGWNKGKKNKDIYGKKRAREISLKQSRSLTGLPTGRCKDDDREQLRRQKISATAKKNGLSGGCRKGSGRGRSGWYKGIWCDSSWELAWVLYNIDHNIKFKRNKLRFTYEYKGKQHQYIPDFMLNENTFIEIKGYITDEVKAKIACIPDKYTLVILQKTEMKSILQYVRKKYGERFIKLYTRKSGRVRFKAAALKAVGAKTSVGSNPTSSAIFLFKELI